MADITQLRRAVVELENGVQWVKALAEVADLKEETREQIQQLLDQAGSLEKQQAQVRIEQKIQFEEEQQHRARLISVLESDLEKLRQIEQKMQEDRLDMAARWQESNSEVLSKIAKGQADLSDKQLAIDEASTSRIIDELSRKIDESTVSLNRQLQAYSDAMSISMKKLRRRIALNRWLTLGYAVLILTAIVLFKFVF
jgi:Fe2+ transport system protein B